ncbi:RNA 3'-terminal phosphate cyclase [Anaeramoeba flamelloides]|uniref:RNA 3'-terminal-phosphate cyclase (ATP) n=1 Tax=Anaeramoeba flamelloides TaxID=1746091 RepID=A0AAV8A2K1_9EUKA|nr:RNA 3'-terminal phosphate cyclase [Anaeramoeba flamelloides]KAJ6237590.1 RNA 3'-terminal phosphate cyclase [Anaeramoeba flamelloides]
MEIDGSIMEGGGQILRLTTSLCAILGRDLKIINIRAKRKPKTGLRPQHLAGIQLVGEICNARLTGDSVQSMQITFKPKKVSCGTYSCDPGTAGSIALLTQISIPVTLFSPGDTILSLKGGTHVNFSPPVTDIKKVLLPLLKKFGATVGLKINRCGFFPRGGGNVLVQSKPVKKLKPIEIVEQGEITKFTGFAFTSGKINNGIATRFIKQYTSTLRSEFGNEVEIKIKQSYLNRKQAMGDGCGIFVYAHTSTGCVLASTGLGQRGKKAEVIARDSANELIQDIKSGACIDRHHQDQVIVFMALADGVSSFRTCKLSLHTKTAIHFAEQITGAKFTIEEENKSVIVKCKGIGYENPNELD